MAYCLITRDDGAACIALGILTRPYPLIERDVDIHTLAKQMGNSAAMIERHYSKLTPTMVADKLA